MSINGINNFKTSTVSGSDQDGWKAETVDTDTSSEDVYESDSSSSSTDSSSALDDYTMGEIENGAYTAPDGTEGAEWLANFPPTVEEICMNNENAINYLDLVEKKYAAAVSDLATLKEEYEKSLASGTLTAEEAKSLTAKLALIDAASSKAKAQVEQCRNLATDRSATFMDEARCCQDLNNDKWIGRPFKEGSIYIHENSDGTIVYVDCNGKPTTLPIADPDYQASLTTGDSLFASDFPPMTDAYPGSTDRVLTFNEASLSNTNEFGCPISMNIPRYFWVRRDPENPLGTDYALTDDASGNQFKMELYDQWDGATQLTPPDLSEWMQVAVTDVVVESEPLAECVGSDPSQLVYDHYVTYYGGENGTDVVARVQITGCQRDNYETDTPNSVTTTLSNDVLVIAASSVGFELHGDNQNVAIDCSTFKSTCRHVVENLHDVLGIGNCPSSDDGSAKRSWNDNIGFFENKTWTTDIWDANEKVEDGEWVDATVPDWNGGDAYSYGDCNDRYMPVGDDNLYDKGVALSTIRTGVFISGVRGKITGTEYNDVIATCGANDFSEYDKDHLPEDAQVRTADQGLYKNFIDSWGGNDIAIVGSGDNYVKDATFVYIKDSERGDLNQITFPERPTIENGYKDEDRPNQKCFFYGKGRGESWVYNPIEGQTLDDQVIKDGDGAGVVGAFDEGYATDDYYNWDSGTAAFGNQYDKGIKNNAAHADFDATAFSQNWSEDVGDWEDDLYAVPSEDDMDLSELNWDDLSGQQSELDAEMNSFFDEAFGGLESAMGEYADDLGLTDDSELEGL
ncbi:MAG: hypothetical protein WC683_14030 [bacterium]